jgi:hypothetical protein
MEAANEKSYSAAVRAILEDNEQLRRRNAARRARV